MKAIHYCGGVQYLTSRDEVVTMLPGWPICCTGSRADAIYGAGTQTRILADVTCKRCLALLEKASRS